VIGTSLRVLDEVGLDGLTLRRLAVGLDVKAQALYWHFTNKQELLDHMAHAMTLPWMEDVCTGSGGRRWDDWLAEVARSYRTLLLSHRDGARLVAGTQPLPESLPLLDGSIAAVQESTGCGPGEALRWLTTLIAFVRGFVLDEHAELLRAQEHPAAGTGLDAGQVPLSAPQDVPHLAAAINDVGPPDGEDTFEYGLALIIAGIRATLESRP
jgi:TetR/AcrR family transcriptional regulator, tetracycline repressor protein